MTLVDTVTGEVVDSLDACEEVIQRGLETFVEVGNALMTIRERGWHRQAGYQNFDAYCRERWGMTRRRSSQLIAAAETMTELESGTTVPTLPSSERQARPLSKLPTPEAKRDAWKQAISKANEDGRDKPTAKDVETIVRKVVAEESGKARQRDEDREAIDEMRENLGLPKPGTPEAKEADRQLDVIATALGWIRDFERRDMRPPAEVIQLAEETDRDVLRRAATAHAWLTELLAETERKFG